MPAAYKTPGVYVEEISTLPPSVVEVSTAIPAFFGYTEKGANSIARVSTLLEFEERFGLAEPATFTATADSDGVVTTTCTPSNFSLYHAISHYFQNGGGACYIVSVGDYAAKTPKKSDFTTTILGLEKEDEPTLLVLTDAIGLTAVDYHDVCIAALAHCQKMGDRFAILDVKEIKKAKDSDPEPDHVGAFRTGVGTNNLAYGAAYYPYLQTTLGYTYNEKNVDVTYPLPDAGTGTPAVPATKTVKLDTLRETSTALYQQVKKEIAAKRVVLPPSAAIAGVYASVDRDRGVWKAPANVSLAGVIAPTVKITNDEQDKLNVNADNGKSINAIRAFAGKGTLVWGARTLAGNDNEWRYVPVRRLFLMIEESSRKATGFAVFEPNDMSTWLKVKGMIESFLYGLWERGALAGSSPEAAYFVDVGLGKTMKPQDILEGRMIVKIGVAAVRPAEFIVLQFSHKLQEA